MPPRKLSGTVALAAIVAAAALLRLQELGGPSYWLDEILGQTLTDRALSQPWWRWIAGLEPEHGPLYYLLQAAARLGGTGEAAGRTPAAIFGILTVPLAWFAARSATRSECAGLAAAALLAVSPLHVYYSREARPYALLMFLTAACLAALLGGARAAGGSPRWMLAASASLVLLLYTSAVGGPAVLAAVVSLFVLAAAGGRLSAWRGPLLVAAGSLLAFPLLYRGVPQQSQGAPFPPIDAAFLEQLLRNFTVSVLEGEGRGRTAVFLAAFALLGAVIVAVRDRVAAVLLLTMTVVPAAAALGVLAWSGHWYSVRYLSPALPGFLVLAAAGVAGVADLLARPFGRYSAAVSSLVVALVTAVLLAQTWPAARREPFRKLDWRGIAAQIWSHAREGDLVLASESWSELSLRYYLDRLPPRVRFRYMAGVGIADIVVKESNGAWLVTAGFAGDEAVRNWTCAWPLLFASPVESFRLHFAPSRGGFLATRATPAERRALVAAHGTDALAIPMRPERDLLLGAGWGAAEVAGPVSTRWAIGTKASVLLPRRRRDDGEIRMRLHPMTAPSLAPQTMSVHLNGAPVGEAILADEWREYAFHADGVLWNGGVNVLDLQFARAKAPADLGVGSSDVRPLAASFDWIALDGADVSADLTKPQRGALRLGGDVEIEQRTIWRGRDEGTAAARLDRRGVEELLARLGLDPSLVWPRIASGRVHLEDVAEILAYDSGCEDDRAFVRRAFASLFGRFPHDHEEDGMARDLRSGVSRERLVGRLLKHPELQAMVMR